MYHGKVIIKSLTTSFPPKDTEKCGYIVQNFYDVLAKRPADFSSLKMVVVKHNHYKAVLRFSCEDINDFVAFRDYFYRYYADRFTWRGKKLWQKE